MRYNFDTLDSLDAEHSELLHLRTENLHLKTLLLKHGIAWDQDTVEPFKTYPANLKSISEETGISTIGTSEKVALFRRSVPTPER